MQISVLYERAIPRKYPEQVAIAIAKDAQGKPNPITLGWTMITSGQPQMMAISIGLTRYSLGAIRQAGEFVISFPSSAMESEVRFFGSKSGRDVDKLAACGTKTQPATKIGGVLLSDACANFECRLEAELETGDHVLFVGRVARSHVSDDPMLRRLYNFGHGEFGVADRMPLP